MLNNPTGLLGLALIVVLLFGGSKIPELMRGLGTGIKEFKNGMSEDPNIDATASVIENR